VQTAMQPGGVSSEEDLSEVVDDWEKAYDWEHACGVIWFFEHASRVSFGLYLFHFKHFGVCRSILPVIFMNSYIIHPYWCLMVGVSSSSFFLFFFSGSLLEIRLISAETGERIHLCCMGEYLLVVTVELCQRI
jgi:hypothetical protein